MSEVAKFTISERFDIAPEGLLRATTQVPMIGDYLPIKMPRYRFTEHITPTLKGLGGGAISFSLGRPFGCVERFDFPQSEQWSQMTPEILITPSPDDSRIWEATIETPTLATPDDMELFGHGLGVYAAYAAASIPPK